MVKINEEGPQMFFVNWKEDQQDHQTPVTNCSSCSIIGFTLQTVELASSKGHCCQFGDMLFLLNAENWPVSSALIG